MEPKQPKQTERRPPRDTEELRNNIFQDEADFDAGKITHKEFQARLKEARVLLKQLRSRL